MELVWLEGAYTKSWKTARVRKGRNMFEWTDRVKKDCIMMYGIEITTTNKLRKTSISELRKVYSDYCSS